MVGRGGRPGNECNQRASNGAAGAAIQKWFEVRTERRIVRERIRFSFGLEKEVERVAHRHVGHEIDLRRGNA